MASIFRSVLAIGALLFPSLVFGQEASLADLNEAIRLNPNNAAALASRGRLFLKMGRNQEAVKDASASLRLDANNAGAYGTRGLAYDRLGDYPHAVADYTASIRLHPTALKYSLRGHCYRVLRQPDKAIADFTEVLHREANNVNALAARASAKSDKDDYAGVIADCSQMLRLDASNANTYHLRGVAFARMGQYDRAIGDFREAIRLNPQASQFYSKDLNAALTQREHSAKETSAHFSAGSTPQ